MTEKSITDEFAKRIRDEIKKQSLQSKTPPAHVVSSESSGGAYNELQSLLGSLNVDIKTPTTRQVFFILR